jgi:hypothetical protein
MEENILLEYQEKLSGEFQEKLSNSPNSILLNEKLNKLGDTIQNKIGQACGREQAEYEKYGRADISGNEMKFTKFQGKENQFDGAWDSYVKCINPYTSLMFPLQSFLRSGADLLNRSYQLCVEGCANQRGNIDQTKTCLKTCFDNNYVNNAKAFQASLIDLAELSIKELQNNQYI